MWILDSRMDNYSFLNLSFSSSLDHVVCVCMCVRVCIYISLYAPVLKYIISGSAMKGWLDRKIAQELLIDFNPVCLLLCFALSEVFF